MELHWEHRFSPILLPPETSGGLGKAGAEDVKRRAGEGSRGAGIPTGKGQAQRGNGARFLLKPHSTSP